MAPSALQNKEPNRKTNDEKRTEDHRSRRRDGVLERVMRKLEKGQEPAKPSKPKLCGSYAPRPATSIKCKRFVCFRGGRAHTR